MSIQAYTLKCNLCGEEINSLFGAWHFYQNHGMTSYNVKKYVTGSAKAKAELEKNIIEYLSGIAEIFRPFEGRMT